MATTTESGSGPREHARFLYPGMVLPFVLLVTCFAAWGTAANMTDTLVSTFQSVFSMSAAQSTLVQSSYYGAYFCLALPAAFINQRFNYKVGVLLGLGLAAGGGLLFLPAAASLTYGFFLVAIFCLAAGLSVLETSANPYVMSMGPEGNATRRLNFAQAFNPVGTNLGVLLAAVLILPQLSEADAEERAAMPPAELERLQQTELTAVMVPYVSLAVLLVVLWIGIALVKVPPGKRATRQGEVDLRGSRSRAGRLLRNKHYTFGVVAQFFNLGAQTCIWTFTLLYVRETIGATQAQAGWWLQASLIVFLVSRFGMVALMGWIDSRILMLCMTILGIVLCGVAMAVPSMVGAVAVVALSGCLSLLFPTIYGISLEGLGEDTKFGAAGLVMAIVGGATVPLVQGALVDVRSAAFSYLVPALCFVVIVGYSVFTLVTPRAIHEQR